MWGRDGEGVGIYNDRGREGIIFVHNIYREERGGKGVIRVIKGGGGNCGRRVEGRVLVRSWLLAPGWLAFTVSPVHILTCYALCEREAFLLLLLLFGA